MPSNAESAFPRPILGGISADCEIERNGARFRENILFTHSGLSGPAALQASLHWNPEATVGYSKAEVTRGGVDTEELSSKTLESKKVPGLYFIGEVVDVTGWLGGYNFQWAWASGWAAGQVA